eukprot:131008-Hanusia_phi.AAC.1
MIGPPGHTGTVAAGPGARGALCHGVTLHVPYAGPGRTAGRRVRAVRAAAPLAQCTATRDVLEPPRRRAGRAPAGARTARPETLTRSGRTVRRSDGGTVTVP